MIEVKRQQDGFTVTITRGSAFTVEFFSLNEIDKLLSAIEKELNKGGK